MAYDSYTAGSYGAYSAGSSGTPDKTASHDPGSTAVDKPMEGRITSDFGWRKDPYTGEQSFHSGIDLAAPAGTDIRSASGGKVVEQGWSDTYGNYIVVKDDTGKTYKYGHMLASSPLKVGSTVQTGTFIGDVGSTGRSTGNHLHFEIRDSSGNPLDPVKLW